MSRQEILIRKSPFLFLKRVVIVEFLFALVPFVLASLLLRDAYEGTSFSRTISYDLLAVIILTTLQVLILGLAFVTWYYAMYRVDGQALLYERGRLFDVVKLTDLAAIRGIDVKQGPLARRLEYGTLVIATDDRDDVVFVRDIPNPPGYRSLLEGLVVDHTARLPGFVPGPVGELIAAGEGQYVEFKASMIWDYRQQRANKELVEPIMKNIAGFLNTTGGMLLIGVSDDGEVLGLEKDYSTMRKRNSDGFENAFNMALGKMVGIEFRPFVDVSFPVLGDQEICAVTVRPSSTPAYLSSKGQEDFYIRTGNSSQPLPVSKATRYIQEHFLSG